MDKIEQMRQQQDGNLKRYLTQAAEIAAEQNADLADALRALPHCQISLDGAVTFYASQTERICVPSLCAHSESIVTSRHYSDYALHIRCGSKTGAPIVGVFEEGGYLRVVEWDGGRTAYAFPYDPKTGMRASGCRMAYRVGKTRKGFFIAIYSRRHYLLPPPSNAIKEGEGC